MVTKIDEIFSRALEMTQRNHVLMTTDRDSYLIGCIELLGQLRELVKRREHGTAPERERITAFYVQALNKYLQADVSHMHPHALTKLILGFNDALAAVSSYEAEDDQNNMRTKDANSAVGDACLFVLNKNNFPEPPTRLPLFMRIVK